MLVNKCILHEHGKSEISYIKSDGKKRNNKNMVTVVIKSLFRLTCCQSPV